ncbi:MAG: hypothetical protein HC883_04795 [Bdellovibrionaceae bacterium]|nr:hypothetical protein [Pseudobdellovibrionaceae bacterium]
MSAAFMVLVLLISAFLRLVTTRMRATGEEIARATQSVRASEELQIHLLNHNREEFLFALTKSKLHEAKLAEERAEIARWLSEAEEYIENEEEGVLYSEVSESIQSYLAAREQISRTRSPLDASTLGSASLDAAYSKATNLTKLNVQQVGDPFRAYVPMTP